MLALITAWGLTYLTVGVVVAVVEARQHSTYVRTEQDTMGIVMMWPFVMLAGVVLLVTCVVTGLVRMLSGQR